MRRTTTEQRPVAISVRRRYAGVAATLLAFAVMLGFGAYSYGESTRMADREVEGLVSERVDHAVAERSREALRHEEAALERALARARSRARRRLRAAVDRAWEDGNTAGYQRGNAAGYAAGRADGRQQGIRQASDELTCSDDSDARLPACVWR